MKEETTSNEFAKNRENITKILSEYKTNRVSCNISEGNFNQTSIEREAKPFIDGYFTLAIVGKVSSGKSTFINALLGYKDLLPVGHDQTTCGITYIEYGEEPQIEITFGDNSKETLKGETIQEELKQYVALPEKYRDLPVNKINKKILGNYTFDEIWEDKSEFEEQTNCSEIDKDLLRKYVNSKSKQNIVKKVNIKFPFNEELKGWRIIDTPGVGAIGGIEDSTRQLLEKKKENATREIDAIIFLQKGNETLDQTDTKQFVQSQLDNFSKLDKSRLFFVLTHASDKNFLNYKDDKLNSIKKHYGNSIKHLSFVDSFLFAFLNELKKTDIDLISFIDDDNFEIDRWNTSELEDIQDILVQAKRELRKNQDTQNNETLQRKIEEWCNFNTLKNEINQFAQKEISKSTSKFFDLVEKDYTSFIKRLESDNNLLKGEVGEIDEKKKDIQKTRANYSLKMGEVGEKLSADEIYSSNFNFVDDEISELSNHHRIQSIRTAVTNLFDRVSNKEKKVFSNILNEYKSFLSIYDINNSNIINSIDFDQIEKDATKDNKERYVAQPEIIEEGGWCEDDTIKPAKYATRVNQEGKLRDFKAVVLQKAKQNRDKFKKQIKLKADNIEEIIIKELKKKIEEEIKRLEGLKKEFDKSNEKIKKNNDLIVQVNTSLKELKQIKKK